MDNLYIKIVDGKPFEHPITGDNLELVFPGIDLENLPEGFAKFQRIPQPIPGVYELVEDCTYETNESGTVYDAWVVRSMTAAEIAAKKSLVQQSFASLGYTSWTFNEELCKFEPPVEYPTDGNPYVWDQETISWKLAPPPLLSDNT